jgi:hypothetical protein
LCADLRAGRNVARYTHYRKCAKKGQEREYVTKERAITAPKREPRKKESAQITIIRLREVGLKKNTSWYLNASYKQNQIWLQKTTHLSR